eukprot:NODE_1993_length_2315_cov_13.157678.p2 GENE.NODE_1993_length_2315_cov_13.157678~~NODE_1993_length_2315_cov_13.157678.p2  ORF type:complete len:269 (+),score=98.59 NODE_1993_length_2315_cov_13.157678:1431-2237(+)
MLTSVGCSTIVAINTERCAEVLTRRQGVAAFCTVYGWKYVQTLNALGSEASDRHHLPIDFEEADIHGCCSSQCDHGHHIFLSHFKAEAGTEATLLKEAIERRLRCDSKHAHRASVFLDSDDLTDLGTLRTHVERSSNIVVLLTPGVLSRAWCLVEIVTAVQNDVTIVPVEVQRPGIKFVYPDEDFFKDLGRGEGLALSDLQLLRELDISLETLEESARSVFRHIALPFSPHKSHNIRSAEMEDILVRCRQKANSSKKKKKKKKKKKSG